MTIICVSTKALGQLFTENDYYLVVILFLFCTVMKLFNPTLQWLICGVYSDFHFIKISFAMKIAQTFLETKSDCFLLFSTLQLHILTKTWLFWFTKYFPKKLQNPLKAYFYLAMSEESHLYLGIGDDLGHLFTKAVIKSASLGQV